MTDVSNLSYIKKIPSHLYTWSMKKVPPFGRSLDSYSIIESTAPPPTPPPLPLKELLEENRWPYIIIRTIISLFLGCVISRWLNYPGGRGRNVYWLVLSQTHQGSKVLGKLNDLYIALCIYKFTKKKNSRIFFRNPWNVSNMFEMIHTSAKILRKKSCKNRMGTEDPKYMKNSLSCFLCHKRSHVSLDLFNYLSDQKTSWAFRCVCEYSVNDSVQKLKSVTLFSVDQNLKCQERANKNTAWWR